MQADEEQATSLSPSTSQRGTQSSSDSEDDPAVPDEPPIYVLPDPAVK